MNTIKFQFYAFIAGLLSAVAGCTDDCERRVFTTYYEPVSISTEEIRTSVAFREAVEINLPGKIYMLGDYLFINEVGEGIHVINNANKRNPVNEKFIEIPGNFDLAARGNILYADSYIDLLAIDIADMNNIRIVKRLQDVFQDHYQIDYMLNSEDAIIVTYREVDTTFIDASECDEVFPSFLRSEGGGPMFPGGGATNDVAFAESPNSAPGVSPASGIGGSMARFTIVNEKLYTVGTHYLKVFDISALADPVEGAYIEIGWWGIETIFPYENNLFIGAQDGMHIYDISMPESPEFISTFRHVTSCDPVVVQDTLAFVTLRSGTECQGFTNQLDVIDIRNLYNPNLIRSYPMDNPHGLGIDGEALFICEGDFGLKIFNAADIYRIDQNMTKHYSDFHAYDVIPFNDVLMMIGEDGLYQYNYSDLENIELLSHIPIIGEEK